MDGCLVLKHLDTSKPFTKFKFAIELSYWVLVRNLALFSFDSLPGGTPNIINELYFFSYMIKQQNEILDTTKLFFYE